MKRYIAIIALAPLVLLWIYFAPTQLGGSTTYVTTSGISMNPLLYQGDLAIVRTQSSYHVGDVVLYQSAVLHAPVLHRIFLVQNGNYFFKGDNNSFVDPGYATRKELVGKLWFRIPGGGAPLTWFAQPLHAGIVAALCAGAIALTSFGVSRKRRRRNIGWEKTVRSRRREATAANPGPSAARSGGPDANVTRDHVPAKTAREPATSRSALMSAPGEKRSFPRSAKTVLALATASMLLAVTTLGVGYSRPTSVVAPMLGAYTQSGTFSYSAKPTSTTSVYPRGVVTTGDPVYRSLVRAVTVHFAYTFKSSLRHHVSGTVAFWGIVTSADGTWQQRFPLQSATAFSGDTKTSSVSIPLSSVYSLLNAVTLNSGATNATYTADIQAYVKVKGDVRNQHVASTFAPMLPFSINQFGATLSVNTIPALPGATYVPPTLSEQRYSTLHPTTSTSLNVRMANKVTFAKYVVQIDDLRLAGMIASVLFALLATLWFLLEPRVLAATDETITSRRMGIIVIRVVTLTASIELEQIEVPNFKELCVLAKFLERPILNYSGTDTHVFAVDDELRRYLFHASLNPSTQMGTSKRGPVNPKHPRRRAEKTRSTHRGRRMATTITSAVLLSGALIVSTSYTASTNVPASSAGASTIARLVSQLAPAGCALNNLTTLIQHSGTFANSQSNVLVLGSSGSDTITDTGSNNCIVGGAGADSIAATASDVCVSGPTLNVAVPCDQNGVSVVASNVPLSPRNVQPTLSIANTATITYLRVSIVVNKSPGVSDTGQGNTYPPTTLNQSKTTTASSIVYSWSLGSGTSIAAHFSGGSVYGQYRSNPKHLTSLDTWSVTSTSSNLTTTITGTF